MNRGAVSIALGVAAAFAPLDPLAADILLTPPAAGGVAITNAAGNATRFRVGDDGIVTLPGLTAVPVPSTGLCVEIATGRVGTCATGIGSVTSITAGTGLTGGTITNSGTIGLAATNLLPATPCGTDQYVKWGGSAWVCATPGSFAGNIELVASTATAGNVLKEGSRFIHSVGISNIFVGANAGSLTTTGSSNAALGAAAMSSITDGNNNVGIGHLALGSQTTGDDNTAVGFQALRNFSGNQSTAIGSGALFTTLTGGANTAVGWHAMYFTTGNSNTAVGHGAMSANSTGGSNVAVGYGVLPVSNSTGNTAVGYRALMDHNTGNANVALGNSSGEGLQTGSNNMYLGASAGASSESSTLRIGLPFGSNFARAFVSGIRGVTTGAADAVPVLIDSNGQLGTASASRQSGEANLGANGAGVNVYTITFPAAFTSEPKVIVTPKLDLFGGNEVNDTFSVTVRAISTTQFKVNVYRVDQAGVGSAANMRLAWTAWE